MRPRDKGIGRRRFLALGAAGAGAAVLGAWGALGCDRIGGIDTGGVEDVADDSGNSDSTTAAVLPPAAPDPDDQFGVDLNINMGNIDSYLGRDDVMYRDMRLLFDTAKFDEIGGDPELSSTIQGFRIIPFPYLGTLPPLPVEGRYSGDVLYVIEWDNEGAIRTAIPKYLQSQQILEEVFPQDKAIFLMCGGGGYAAFMKKLLVFLGWDEDRIYNIGGAWDYKGENPVDLVLYDEAGKPYYYYWRAMYTMIDFSQFTLLAAGAAESKNPTGLKKQSKHCQW
jgi:hypothetical protein